ncbi:helix-turn-helix transcriptional regulator [Streptomyces parvus]|uniref:helix-turn-helix transcriptional regulator n=1 Tax=Streptomyces parvus TaxID=66428 RepID=UPI00371F04E6
MKFDRLLSVLLLLQQRDRVTATELAERLEVSVRTVYRDVEALSSAGVPVYAERGRYGGIRLLPGFRTDMTGLTQDEARALFVLVSQSAHSALGLDRAMGSALRKMMTALPAPHRPAAELTSRRLMIDPQGWLAGQHEETDVTRLYEAVLTDCRLRISYRHSGNATPRTYTVDPYGLVSKAGAWYLVADRDGQPALHRADRLRDLHVTEEPVRHRAGVELGTVWEELRQQVEERGQGFVVRARVRHGRMDMVRRITGAHFRRVAEPASEESGEAADGARGPAADGAEGAEGARRAEWDDWRTVELEYPVPAAVRQLLQFGTDVEVLGPPEALAEMARAVSGLAALYPRTG